MNPLKIGDVVRLASGGEWMTVTHVYDTGYVDATRQDCYYQLQTVRIPADALVKKRQQK